jgi:hypothetical protein
MVVDDGYCYHLSGRLAGHRLHLRLRLGPHPHPCQAAKGGCEQVLVILVSIVVYHPLSWAGNIPATRALLDRRGGSLDPCAGVGVEEDDSLGLKVRFLPASTTLEGPNDMLEGPTMQIIGHGLRVHIFITIS